MAETKASMKKTVRGITYWKATKNFNESTGETTVTYGAANQLNTYKSGTRAYSMDPRGESQTVYADGIKVFGETVNDGYDLVLTLLSLLDKVVLKDWLGYTEVQGGVAEYATSDELPYFGMCIYEETSDGVGQTLWFPYVQANGRPSDAGKTSEGTSFDFAYPDFPLIASPSPADKLVMYKLDGMNRRTEVPSGLQLSGIMLREKRIEIVEDDEYTLTALTVPAGATVTWTSGSSSVATVSGGVVTAEGEGNTIITASITDSGVTYTDTCTVIVAAKT